MQRIANYINGQLVEPLGGKYLDNYNPATGSVYSQVPASDDQDVVQAVNAASTAFATWSQLTAAQRRSYLNRLADLIEANSDRLAKAESTDNGKPLTLARSLDIPRSASNFRFFAHAIEYDSSEAHVTDHSAINYTLRRPRGVVGVISPWNLPLYLLTWKVAPALATGNTVVAKPSEVTPMTAFLLSELCQEAELPPGVLNIVHGAGNITGEALIQHPKTTTLSFTGSTQTGQHIASVAAPLFKKYSLEMGGKNPTIIFDDCDFEQVVDQSVRAAFANQGQVCLCGSRILVEDSIYDKFVTSFVKQVKALRVGDPTDPTTDQGAIVSQQHLKKIKSYVDLARSDGGTIACGGETPSQLSETLRNGYFFEPTVITGLDSKCRVNQEEIFGPVASVMPFNSEHQAIEFANATSYGLAASIWTQDVDRAHRVADQVDSGIVWVNCWMLRDLRTPFGGMKQSGVGREGGQEALRFFTEPKNICIKVANLKA